MSNSMDRQSTGNKILGEVLVRIPLTTFPNFVTNMFAYPGVRYRGTQQDSNYQIDALDISGPLDAQVRGSLAFVRRNMLWRQQKTRNVEKCLSSAYVRFLRRW